jgi:hypothetical protein
MTNTATTTYSFSIAKAWQPVPTVQIDLLEGATQ